MYVYFYICMYVFWYVYMMMYILNVYLCVCMYVGGIDADSDQHPPEPAVSHSLRIGAHLRQPDLGKDLQTLCKLFIHTFSHTHIHTYIHRCIQPFKIFTPNRTSTLLELLSLKYTYIHTYIHTY